MYNVGDTAVYPGHGIGVIKRIETRRIGGANQDFYVLQITATGATLMIPTDSTERACMRPLASSEEIDEALAVLSSPPKVSHTTWNRRFREFNDLLRTGSTKEVAGVLRDLEGIRKDKDLSYGEKKMMDKAISLLSNEIAMVRGIEVQKAEIIILDHLNADKDWQREGYEDATSGRRLNSQHPDYLAGFREGLIAKVKWATDDLKNFDANSQVE